MSHNTHLDPFSILAKRIKPLGGELTSGTVTAVDATAKRITITTPAGVSVPNVPYTGGGVENGSQVWIIRNGTTLLAFGSVAGGAFTFSTGAPAGVAPAGSVHLNTSTWEIYEYV